VISSKRVPSAVNKRPTLNEPGGPGGRDPVTNIYGPTATRGHFGAMNVGCFLTLRHRVGPPETGWFTLGEAPSWTPGP
jgi:hypothetical protein